MQGKEDGSQCQADLYHRRSAYSSTFESGWLDLPRDFGYTRGPVNSELKDQACSAARQIDESSTQATTTAFCLEGVPPSKNIPSHGPGASYHQLFK